MLTTATELLCYDKKNYYEHAIDEYGNERPYLQKVHSLVTAFDILLGIIAAGIGFAVPHLGLSNTFKWIFITAGGSYVIGSILLRSALCYSPEKEAPSSSKERESLLSALKRTNLLFELYFLAKAARKESKEAMERSNLLSAQALEAKKKREELDLKRWQTLDWSIKFKQKGEQDEGERARTSYEDFCAQTEPVEKREKELAFIAERAKNSATLCAREAKEIDEKRAEIPKFLFFSVLSDKMGRCISQIKKIVIEIFPYLAMIAAGLLLITVIPGPAYHLNPKYRIILLSAGSMGFAFSAAALLLRIKYRTAWKNYSLPGWIEDHFRDPKVLPWPPDWE